MKKVSIVITNWNGKHLLEKSLPEVIKNSPEAQEIIVVDDFSTDDSLSFLKQFQKKNPRLVIVSQTENKGFSNTSNLGVQTAKGEYVVLLNSDIYPTKGYIKTSLLHFLDKSIFGVGFAEIGNENYPRIYWSEGYLQYEPVKSSTSHIAAWISGGGCIIRKSYFQRLNGFDEVYKPFYSEDLDLGYRAWKSGYKLVWEPKSKVYHKHGSTTSKFPRHFSDYVKERNRLLVTWRNVTEPDFVSSNIKGIIFRVLLGPNYIKIIRAAKKQLSLYPKPVCFPVLTDRQVFNLFKQTDET